MVTEVTRGAESADRLSDSPRVLVVDFIEIGSATATGQVKQRLFQGWPTSSLLQIYSTGTAQFGLRDGSRVLETHIAKSEARDAATRFNPDVIYVRPLADPPQFADLTWALLEQFEGVPTVVHIMDDWPRRLQLQAPADFRRVDERLRELLCRANLRMSISPEMSSEYWRRYGLRFEDYANFVDVSEVMHARMQRPLADEAPSPLTLRYSGNLADDMTRESLHDIARAVEEIGSAALLEIAALGPWSGAPAEEFKGYQRTSVERARDDPADYRSWLSGADVCVIAYNFDARTAAYTKLSMANKLPDYLGAAKPILAYGPPDFATIRKCLISGAAHLVTERERPLLRAAVLSFLEDPDRRRRMGEQGQQFALAHLNTAVRRSFQARLREAAAAGSPDPWHPMDGHLVVEESRPPWSAPARSGPQGECRGDDVVPKRLSAQEAIPTAMPRAPGATGPGERSEKGGRMKRSRQHVAAQGDAAETDARTRAVREEARRSLPARELRSLLWLQPPYLGLPLWAALLSFVAAGAAIVGPRPSELVVHSLLVGGGIAVSVAVAAAMLRVHNESLRRQRRSRRNTRRLINRRVRKAATANRRVMKAAAADIAAWRGDISKLLEQWGTSQAGLVSEVQEQREEWRKALEGVQREVEQLSGAVAQAGQARVADFVQWQAGQAGLVSEVQEQREEWRKALEGVQREVEQLSGAVAQAGQARVADVEQWQADLAALTSEVQEQRQVHCSSEASMEEKVAALQTRLEDLADAAHSGAPSKSRLSASPEAVNSHAVRSSNHQPLQSHLADNELARLTDHWSALLGCRMTKAEVDYLASRVGVLESTSAGGPARSVEAAVLMMMLARASLENARAAGRPMTVLEIGTLFGVRLGLVYDACRDRSVALQVHAIDPLNGSYTEGITDIATGVPARRSTLEANLHAMGVPLDDFVLHQDLSANVLPTSDHRIRFDLIIVDGDHTYDAVKSDGEGVLPLLQPGGYLLFDDYGNPDWPDVKRYVDDCLLFRNGLQLIGHEFASIVFRKLGT